ncbi:MAG: transporter substrate-binding domain-containing protein [Hyphomicrobiales bacterium]|nr:transporter substrate-binding domain-containing protein [Hyphomicrobiales bacterium]MDE2018095.1 transporter substrate-binding domain-containing protein [Hyphomicrobiales bacterium]
MEVGRRLVVGALCAAALSFSGVARAADALQSIMAAKEVKIAIPTDFAPYGFVGTDLAPQGLDIDMANLVGAKLGVKTTLVPVTSANRIPYLQTGKADLVISTLGKTPERAAVIDFTHAYSPFFVGIFGPKGVPAAKPADLAGMSIAVTRGAVEDTELTKVAPPSTDVHRFEDNNATIAAFLSGQTKLVATSVQVAQAIMKKDPSLGVEYKFLLKDSPNFIGVAKGQDALRAKLDAIIAAARADGELDALSKKWLGRPVGDLP